MTFEIVTSGIRCPRPVNSDGTSRFGAQRCLELQEKFV